MSEKGLNRTMQYGNTIARDVNSRYLYGLNRTMQYGNAFPLPDLKEGKIV